LPLMRARIDSSRDETVCGVKSAICDGAGKRQRAMTIRTVVVVTGPYFSIRMNDDDRSWAAVGSIFQSVNGDVDAGFGAAFDGDDGDRTVGGWWRVAVCSFGV